MKKDFYEMKPSCVILVEDDPLIAFQITTVLEELGHTAIVVSEPAAAMRLVQKDEPGAVIVNLQYGFERRPNIMALLNLLLLRSVGMLLLTGARKQDMACVLPSEEQLPILFKPFTSRQLKGHLLELL